MTTSPLRPPAHHTRHGIALVAVLYFLVVCGLMAAAVLYAERSAVRNTGTSANGAQLMAIAEGALYSAIAEWNAAARIRQQIGATAAVPASSTSGAHTTVNVTRLGAELFSIVAEARGADGAARRVSLLIRQPRPAPRFRAALVSAVDVTLGPGARIVADSATCGDTATAATVLAPSVAFNQGPGAPMPAPGVVVRDSSAADSATYLQFGNRWWIDLAGGADVRLPDGARVTPTPDVSDDHCTRADGNWGDPRSLTSPCADRVPVIVAAGDLTIDGGVGQGVLLVDGHLIIDGPFVFSGQIVARGGIETLADNITITGAVYAWRASADTHVVRARVPAVVLTHQTTLRYSGCDAWHGVASWLQSRRVRDHAWTELF